LSAVIVTLMEIGWKPIRPAEWIDPSGALWKTDGRLVDFTQLFEQLAQDCHSLLCESTVKGHNGAGIDKGLDFWTHKTKINKLIKDHHFAEAGTTRMIAAGGVWGRARIAEAKKQNKKGEEETDYDDKCELCHEEADTDLHRFWTCKCIIEAISNAEHMDEVDKERHRESIRKSNHLIKDAVKGVEMGQACYYLRGLIPKEWTAEKKDAVKADFKRYSGNASASELLEVKVAFVDGSGTTNDPRLRRTGWSAIWLNEAGTDLEGGILGSCPDEKQSVAFAELYAVHQLLVHTKGDITIWSDCEYTVKGFHSRRWRLEACKHRDLWRDVGYEAKDRKVVIKWTKAHVEVNHIITGKATVANIFGNEIADEFAKFAGKKADEMRGLSYGLQLGFIEGRAHLIRNRLLAAMVCRFGSREPVPDIAETIKPKVIKRKKADDEPPPLPPPKPEQLREHLLGQVGYKGDPSHEIVLHQGRWLCTKCGSVATVSKPKYYKLAAVCIPAQATRYAQQVVREYTSGKASSFANRPAQAKKARIGPSAS
jgi:ribonuclease HI